jgi:hypothetical protein
MAWLPFESEIAMNSEKLVLKYNPNWSGGGLKRYQSKEPVGKVIWNPFRYHHMDSSLHLYKSLQRNINCFTGSCHLLILP